MLFVVAARDGLRARIGYPGDMALAYSIAILRKSCWHCTKFDGFVSGGVHSRCLHDGYLTIVNPLGGCVHFDRVPGSDDILAPPAEFSTGGISGSMRDAIAEVVAWERSA